MKILEKTLFAGFGGQGAGLLFALFQLLAADLLLILAPVLRP